uniref:Variant surface glycoprotein R1D12 n=1 Tax=Trypanosoma evansi TaxID=5697 RepID=F2X0K4_TRYEV|nr:variant surface glycoprotein R1D12 [Trypanosoma evansi]
MDCHTKETLGVTQWRRSTMLTLSLLYAITPADGAKEALEYKTWTNHCGLAATLRKVAGGVLTKLKSHINYRQKLEEMETKLRIYALKGDGVGEQKSAEILATTAALMRQKALTPEEANLKTALKAAGFAGEGAAAVSSYLMTLGTLTTSGSAHCLSNEGGNGDGKDQLAPKGCRHGTEADFDAGAGPAESEVADSGFAQVPGKQDGANAGQANMCALFTHQATPHSSQGIYITGAQTKPSFGYGMLTIGTTDQTIGLKLSDIKGKQADSAQKFWSSCHAAVKAAQDMKADPALKVDQTLLAVLVASPEMAEILKLEAAASQQKGPEEVTIDLATEKNNYFGTNNNKLEPLWTKIKGQNIVDLAATKGSTKELGTVTDTAELQKLLSYYYTVNKEEQKKTAEKITKLETELADQKGKSPESECNKISEEPKCNEDKICSWHKEVKAGEKHCKFNSTKAKEKGVSVTQTQTAGGTEATTDKCKGKLEDTCKKESNCKWENNACKDSSILVTKKLALSAAAFAALLF